MQPPYGPQGQQGYPQQQQYPQQAPPPQKKGTNPIVIILAVIGGIIVLGFGGCVVCVGAGANAVAQADKKEKAQKAEAKSEVLKVAARDIIEAYKGNEVKADNKYKGKYVEVSGIVANVAKDIMDHPYVTVGTGADFEVIEVQCTFAEKSSAAAADIEKGKKIKLRGFVKGKMMNVLLEDCEIP